MKSFKFMGWVRDGKGKVIKRPLKDICNCVTVAPYRSVCGTLLSRDYKEPKMVLICIDEMV